MPSDEWPRVRCERFDGESREAFVHRAARAEAIIWGFRSGRFRNETAEMLEQELLSLLEPDTRRSPTWTSAGCDGVGLDWSESAVYRASIE